MRALKAICLYVFAVPFFFWELAKEQRSAIYMAHLSSFAVVNSMMRKSKR